MNINMVYPPRPERRGRVIALHCSGGGASQWSYLAEALGGRYELIAPEHYGSESAGPWPGERAFALSDEAARTIALIDSSEAAVHLVGHSYGGGVALQVALARPHRIASMALYEPSAFHLLPRLGEPGRAAFAEINGVAAHMGRCVIAGNYREAVAVFVDYWNGAGSWDALRPAVQSALIRWTPKGPMDFRALMNDPTLPTAYRELDFPVLILRGEHAPAPTRIVADGLSTLLRNNQVVTIEGAGHMGPLTHAPEVAALMVRHFVRAGNDTAPVWKRHRSVGHGTAPGIARAS